MTIEDNKALVRRFVDEIFVEGRPEAVDELLADDFVPHKGLSDPVFTIEDMIAEDDRVGPVGQKPGPQEPCPRAPGSRRRRFRHPHG